MGWLGRSASLAAVLAACWSAAAQVKPPAGGDAAPSGPDKFAAPPPRAAPPVGPPADKFAAPPAPQTVPPPGVAPAPPPVAAVPPGEPAAVQRLRALLGPETTLTYRTAESLDPAKGSVRLLDVAMEGRGRRVGMEELTLDGLRDDGVGEATARGMTLRDAGNDQRGAMAVARLRLAGLAVQRPPPGGEFRPDMLRLDTLRMEGVRATGDYPTAAAEFAVEDYGAGRPGRVSLSGLEARDPRSGNRVTVARAALRGLDLAAALSAAATSQAPPRAQGSYAFEVEDLAVRDGARPLGGFGTLRVTVEVPARGPETGGLALRDLRIEAVPAIAEWLRRFGYDAVTADLSAESRYDRDAKRAELTSLSLSGREIGAIGLAVALDGVTAASAEQGDAKDMRLLSAMLRYVDQSLYGRFVRQQAREKRVSEAQVRQEQADTAAMMVGFLGQGPGVDAVRAALVRFLRGEAREVEITLKPPVPLAVTEFGGGPPNAALLGRMGLGATAR